MYFVILETSKIPGNIDCINLLAHSLSLTAYSSPKRSLQIYICSYCHPLDKWLKRNPTNFVWSYPTDISPHRNSANMNEVAKIKEINNISDFNSLRDSDVLMVLFSITTSSTRCEMSQAFWNLAEDFSCNSIVFAECDVEEADEVCEAVDVPAYPSILVYKKGVRSECYVGYRPENLMSFVTRNIFT